MFIVCRDFLLYVIVKMSQSFFYLVTCRLWVVGTWYVEFGVPVFHVVRSVIAGIIDVLEVPSDVLPEAVEVDICIVWFLQAETGLCCLFVGEEGNEKRLFLPTTLDISELPFNF